MSRHAPGISAELSASVILFDPVVKPVSAPALPLPALAPQLGIERALSEAEYYHAAIGQHAAAHIRSHEVVVVLEGQGALSAQAWQDAVTAASGANPGSRLRLVGTRRGARWLSDAAPPRLRWVAHSAWNGWSSDHLTELLADDLDLRAGFSCEIIVVGQGQDKPLRPGPLKLVFRVSHATMDGVGLLHFMQEVFRSLRGEPLLGTNVGFTDTELMRHRRHLVQPPRRVAGFRPTSLVGPAAGEARGGCWRRLSLAGPLPQLLPRLLVALALWGREHNEVPLSFSLPANLRRHVPDMLTTSNFASMTHLDLQPDEPAELEYLKARLKSINDRNEDLYMRPGYGLVRYLPFGWIDRLVSVGEHNYRNPTLHETAVVSVLGSYKKAAFSGPGFKARRMFVLPQLENTFITGIGLQGSFDLCVGMPQVFASNGRLEALIAHLEQYFIEHPA